MRPLLLAAVLMTAASTVAGPISKYDDDQPDIKQLSVVGIYDLERCLTDLNGWPVPFIYRQPDKPDESRLLWVLGPGGQTIARADLKTVDGGTAVKIWKAKGNQVRRCVETGNAN